MHRWLVMSRRVPTPSGRLVLGDVVPANVSPLIDAGALLKFAMQNGFLAAAATGLVRTYFSNYRKKRSGVGVLQVDEGASRSHIERSGFSARKHAKNLAHNPARLPLIAPPRASQAT